jgi:hypothetical protein
MYSSKPIVYLTHNKKTQFYFPRLSNYLKSEDNVDVIVVDGATVVFFGPSTPPAYNPPATMPPTITSVINVAISLVIAGSIIYLFR